MISTVMTQALAQALALALAAAPAAAGPQAPATTPALNPWAVQFDLPSAITGRTYRIYVTKPLGPTPKAGWPVIYVLDADVTFPSLAAQMMMRTAGGDSGALLVGIAYPNALATMTLRTRDLTPSQPTAAAAALAGLPKPKVEDFGGSAAFHRFMIEELRPRIAAGYPIDPADQTLMGYSLGGLFALGVLFQHPQAYRTYVIGSPSIWWNDREVLAGEAGFSAAVRAGTVAPRILITSDAWEQDPASPALPPPGPKRDAELKELAAARMVDNARDLAGRLAALKGAPGYSVHYTLFPEETHNTGIPAASMRGLTFALTP